MLVELQILSKATIFRCHGMYSALLCTRVTKCWTYNIKERTSLSIGKLFTMTSEKRKRQKKKKKKTWKRIPVQSCLMTPRPLESKSRIFNLTELITCMCRTSRFRLIRGTRHRVHHPEEDLVSLCLEPGQPQKITSRLNTNFSLSPSYLFHKSLYHIFSPNYSSNSMHNVGTQNQKNNSLYFGAYLYSASTQRGNLHPAR